MKNIFLLIPVITTNLVFASFETLRSDYLKSSTYELQVIKEKSNENKFLFEDNLNELRLDLKRNFSRTGRQNLNAFQPTETVLHTTSLGLVKPTTHFGTFSFEHRQNEYDISRWSAGLRPGLADKQYETVNVFGYSYDFIDNSLSLSSDLAQINNKIQKIQNDINSDENLLNLFVSYSKANMAYKNVLLTRRALVKARKRYRTIKKRVSNGASRKLDLLLAKSLLESRTNSVETAKASFELEKVSAENLVGKTLTMSDFQKDAFVKQLNPRQSNKAIKLLENQLALNLKNIEKNNNDTGYKLSLNLGYVINAINEDRTKSIDDSFDGYHDKTASINLSIPLGITKNSASSKYYKFEKQYLKKSIETQKLQVMKNIKAFDNQIKFLTFAIDNLENQKKILIKALSETNKLYLRGRSNFDELIRREEELINCETQMASSKNNLNQLIANKMYTLGQIRSFVMSVKDI
ncbi:MAG: TolC family protein [Bacteriovoracaceae bacterium]|jgi:outer membrane protein TolC|nr:TolC family protein [Bacteriovoracaceae bacterium]